MSNLLSLPVHSSSPFCPSGSSCISSNSSPWCWALFLLHIFSLDFPHPLLLCNDKSYICTSLPCLTHSPVSYFQQFSDTPPLDVTTKSAQAKPTACAPFPYRPLPTLLFTTFQRSICYHLSFSFPPLVGVYWLRE